MQLRIIFYGGLKQTVGAKGHTLELEPDSVTVHELKALLADRYPALAPRLATVACAVGDELAGPDHRLRDGDEVALLPPVSGG